MSCIVGFLNNASVGAFVGAASAFFLVVLLDWKRNRRKARTGIPALLRRQRTLAANRRATAEQARDDRSRSIAIKEPPFGVDALMRLAEEVPDYSLSDSSKGSTTSHCSCERRTG